MTDDEEIFLPHYVYMLIDTTSNPRKPFYIGKGSASRHKQHEIDVRKELGQIAERLVGEEKRPDKRQAPKAQRISDLLDKVDEVQAVVVGRYKTAREAFSVEAILVHFVYGKDTLTNTASGHGSNFIRSKEIINEELETGKFQKINGIDVALDGSEYTYANIKKAGLKLAGAYSFLEEIKTRCSEEGFVCREFCGEEKKFHPGEATGYLALIVRIKGIDFSIQISKAKKPAIYMIYTNSTKENLKENDSSALVELVRRGGDQEFMIQKKKNGIYAPLFRSEKVQTLEELIAKLKSVKQVLDGCK